MIEFKHVSKEYRDNKLTRALDGVDLTVADGEFVFIVGDSGAGKTTLLRLLMGMEKPTEGSIVVDGRDVCSLNARELPLYRRRFGCIFQDFRLLKDFDAFGNVAFAQRVVNTKASGIKKRVPRVLEQVGLADKAGQYPDQLSGGEQQRVAIARALVNGPLYILADEPTGNLDPANAEEVMRILEEINKTGTTVIVITHAASFVNRMKKRVISMKNGRILADIAEGGYDSAAQSSLSD